MSSHKLKNDKTLLNFEDVLNTYKSKEHGKRALSKYIHWFPLKASVRLAGIVADLIGDGHLQDYPKYRLDYTSNSNKELNRFNKEIFYLFGIKGKIRDCKTNKYNTKNLGINNKPLARVLKLIGVPTGAKVLSKFSIPKWILNDKTLFLRFINRLFSCEGSIDLQNKYIELKMHKSVTLIEDGINFFKDIKKYLDKYFGIKTTKPFLEGRTNTRKDSIKTKGIRIKIKNRESLVRFKKFVGLDDKEKKIRLNKILK